MHVLVASWSTYGGGRARALLSLVDYLATNSIRVSILKGTDSWPVGRLQQHHDIYPEVNWYPTDWETPVQTLQETVENVDPDVVISWDQLLNTKLRAIDKPTIGYCRTNYATGLDEYWCPSRQTASQTSQETRDRESKTVHPIYPVWYIEGGESDHRPIDVVVHGRKANDIVSQLKPKYNVVVANRFEYADLREVYLQSKLFVFPRPDRFEPLGLMPIEAAAHGCNLCLPENSGVSEIYPDCAFETPREHIEETLHSKQSHSVPASPTDPVKRIHARSHS